ncbi:GTPase activating factor [Exophiala xenobiotica]|uniref:GTPase activating factor n=1 Tax=Lithohypha guttulata TaxID=1690604 RepID=A0ABR0K4Z4_9EURO|nr:GTPase activating factor [Lithohypha guttulata]KAK5326112.1 GTPase activating factor [Exophiala xenobiotica]
MRKNEGRNGMANIDRRPSRRRSEVRHGRIYEETEDSTIRAVTPDSAGSVNMDITALPSPPSFLPQNPSQYQMQEPSPSVSNTDEESTIEHRRRKVKKRSKHHDTGPSDTSPNSFFEKTRKRLNSITTASTSAPRQGDANVSIGFPSVVQASVFPDMQDMKRQLPRTPRRTFSSDTATTAGTSSIRSPLLIESDAEKVLKLMKTLCGRMHGILFYRPIGTTSWDSGYCAINVAPGSLVRQAKGDVTKQETLIPDLRGCTVRTHYDPQEQSAYLSVVHPVSGSGYQLRPPVPETFESWLAALLCWQPMRPKGIHNKMAKPQSISVSDRPNMGSRRMSDMSGPRSTAVVKSSQMLLWDGTLPAGSFRHQVKRMKLGPSEQHGLWRRVNCTLHENGTLRLLAEGNATPIRSMKLNSLARCAIQRLDESVLGAKHCIAIHPQYSVNAVQMSATNPLVSSLDSRVAFEAWFVLLQAMTVPELYGPKVDPSNVNRPKSSEDSTTRRNMFRVERSLHIKIIEARFPEHIRGQDQRGPQHPTSAPRNYDRRGTGVYADVMLGRELRARTVDKPFSNSIFWAEEFYLPDIPSMLSSVSIVLKMGNPDEKEWTMTTKGDYDVPADDGAPDFEAIEVASHDAVYGRVDVPLYDLEQARFVEKWWPLVDSNGGDIGQGLIRLSLGENVVLMEAEYAQLSALLHNFDNSLTSQLGQALGNELKSLSDVLLDVFQTSDTVEDWINNLVEEEIDGIYREQPPLRMRYSGRIHSNDSYESAEQRELLVRDLSRSATMEANLLFRGNSLVTKALDAHMRRLGSDYLDRTLGDKLRDIVANDPNCEVDPNRVRSNEQLERNWSNLIGLTSSIWQAIAASVPNCPAGIRNILKHIRSCAEDRYGSFIRTVKYTSVSGFLFLRFFCPAILNPKLFGLLDDHPPERPRRTFTLIAKSLIVLGNLSKFGQKEPWMEPMNRFLTAASPEFKIFIEEICSWSASRDPHHEPQYQAAAQVKLRLPPLSREGLPSLPFLLDCPRSLATLVNIWVENAPANIDDIGVEDSVQTFHQLCLDLKQRTTECMADAETAQEPDKTHERQWQKMLSEHPRSGFVLNPFEEMSMENDVTALPQQPGTRKYSSRNVLSGDGYAGDVSPTIEEQAESPPGLTTRTLTSSTNSSSASFEVFDDYRKRQGLRSREGPVRNRFLEISNPRRGRTEPAPGDDIVGRF